MTQYLVFVYPTHDDKYFLELVCTKETLWEKKFAPYSLRRIIFEMAEPAMIIDAETCEQAEAAARARLGIKVCGKAGCEQEPCTWCVYDATLAKCAKIISYENWDKLTE